MLLPKNVSNDAGETMKVRLANQVVTISAARSQVFQQFSSFGKVDQAGENQTGENGEGANVLEREGNRLLVKFNSRDGRKLYTTLEEVNLYPEKRITFLHLNGPLHYASEEFRLEESLEGTHITYSGQNERRMSFLPGIGWLVALLYVRPKWGSVVKRHMGLLKETAEARALEAAV